MKQRISVVVPVYNSEKYLKQCVDSILCQTYQEIELILVDDGSTDASGTMCDSYMERDRRVSVIHKDNEGPIKARLSGALKARGNCITFVDGDDWIARDTYERMMRCMGNNDLVMAGVFRYFTKDMIKTDIPMLREGEYDKRALENAVIPYMLWSSKRNTWELDPSLCTKIFKRELLINFLEKAGTLDTHFGDDTAVIFPLMLKTGSAAVMHDCFYYHRQRLSGMVPSYFQDEAFLEKLYSLYEYLKTAFWQSPYWEILSPQLEHFYLNAVQLKQKSFSDYTETNEDVFPFWEIRKGADVILYGAGETGKKFYEQNEQYHFCKIGLWADRNYEKLSRENARIVSPERIAAEIFDYIVIAVRSAEVMQEIARMLVEMGIPIEKIVWNGVFVRKVMINREKNN